MEEVMDAVEFNKKWKRLAFSLGLALILVAVVYMGSNFSLSFRSNMLGGEGGFSQIQKNVTELSVRTANIEAAVQELKARQFRAEHIIPNTSSISKEVRALAPAITAVKETMPANMRKHWNAVVSSIPAVKVKKQNSIKRIKNVTETASVKEQGMGSKGITPDEIDEMLKETEKQ